MANITIVFSINKANDQAIALFRRNHLYAYEGMWLKYFWHIFMPCLPIILYNALSLIGVFGNSGSEMPRAVSISTGLIFYLVFSETILLLSNTLVYNQNYIKKTGVNLISCYWSSIYIVMMNFSIRYMMFCALLLLFPAYITPRLLLGPLYTIYIILFSAGIAAFLSIFVVFYKDVSNFVQAVMFYLLFASGVFGFVDTESAIGKAVSVLPSYIFVSNGKNLILGIGVVEFGSLLSIGGVGVLMIALSIIGNRNCKPLVLNYLR